MTIVPHACAPNLISITWPAKKWTVGSSRGTVPRARGTTVVSIYPQSPCGSTRFSMLLQQQVQKIELIQVVNHRQVATQQQALAKRLQPGVVFLHYGVSNSSPWENRSVIKNIEFKNTCKFAWVSMRFDHLSLHVTTFRVCCADLSCEYFDFVKFPRPVKFSGTIYWNLFSGAHGTPASWVGGRSRENAQWFL